MNTAKIENDFIVFELIDGILYATYKTEEISLEIAKKVVKLRKEITNGGAYPNLVSLTKASKIEKNARDYFSTPEGIIGVSAGAVVTKSLFQTTLVNFFLKVSKPKIPSKMFTNKKDAVKWLNKYK